MSLFRVEGATPDENDESTEHSLAARLAAVRATAEEAQTTVDESAAQYQTLIREQVAFHAHYVPAFDDDPAGRTTSWRELGSALTTSGRSERVCGQIGTSATASIDGCSTGPPPDRA